MSEEGTCGFSSGWIAFITGDLSCSVVLVTNNIRAFC
jgi:hypothetical protein